MTFATVRYNTEMSQEYADLYADCSKPAVAEHVITDRCRVALCAKKFSDSPIRPAVSTCEQSRAELLSRSRRTVLTIRRALIFWGRVGNDGGEW